MTDTIASEPKKSFWHLPTLKYREFLGYSSGGAASALTAAFMASNLMFFLTDIWLIDPVVVGTIFLVTRLLDAITDPIIGVIADRTQTRYGKYRPYLIFAAPLLGMSIALLFSAPELSPTTKVIAAYAFYIFFGLMFTIVNIPFHGLTPIMTRHPVERTMLISAKQIFAVLGGTAARSAPILLVSQFEDAAEGWRIAGILCGVIATAFYWFCAYGATRRDRSDSHEGPKKEKSNLTLKEQFHVVIENKPFLALLVANSTNLFALNMRGAMGLYFFMYYVGDIKMVAELQIYNLPFLFAVLLLLPALISLVSKKSLYVYSSAFSMIAGIVAYFWVPHLGNSGIFWLLFLITPIELISMKLQWVLLPDCADYGRHKTGVNCSALLVSVNELMNKFCGAFAGLLVGACLAWANYQPNVEQTDSALEMILFINFIPVSIAHFFTVVAMYFYKLTSEDSERISAELEKIGA